MKVKAKINIDGCIVREIGVYEIPEIIGTKYSIVLPKLPELAPFQITTIEFECLEGKKGQVKTISFSDFNINNVDEMVNEWTNAMIDREVLNIESYKGNDLHYRIITYIE